MEWSPNFLRFQKPYSFEALFERTIEIIDTPLTLAIDSKPAVRSQAGRDVALSDNTGVGLQTSEPEEYRNELSQR